MPKVMNDQGRIKKFWEGGRGPPMVTYRKEGVHYVKWAYIRLGAKRGSWPCWPPSGLMNEANCKEVGLTKITMHSVQFESAKVIVTDYICGNPILFLQRGKNCSPGLQYDGQELNIMRSWVIYAACLSFLGETPVELHVLIAPLRLLIWLWSAIKPHCNMGCCWSKKELCNRITGLIDWLNENSTIWFITTGTHWGG